MLTIQKCAGSRDQIVDAFETGRAGHGLDSLGVPAVLSPPSRVDEDRFFQRSDDESQVGPPSASMK